MFVSLCGDYLWWHYTDALRQLFRIWINFMWFATHYFSIPLLITSLFAPWKRMTERAGAFTFEAYGEALIVNMMSRVIGFFLRLIIISVGLIVLVGLFLGIVLVIGTWLVAPALVFGLLSYGATLLF
ncbi:MAG: hypothetical protein AAGA35_03570 [Patescibacteria group bacterium]